MYQKGGTLTISEYGGKAIKADGAIYYRGGTQNFDTTDTQFTTGLSVGKISQTNSDSFIYDLNGRRVNNMSHGIYIQNGKKFLK